MRIPILYYTTEDLERLQNLESGGERVAPFPF